MAERTIPAAMPARNLPVASASQRAGWGKMLTRRLSWAHRWVGIVMCLFFSAWFISGAIMVFVPFPSLSDAERYAGQPAVDVLHLRVTPEAAATASGLGVDSIELIQGVTTPIYVVRDNNGRTVVVDGVTGARHATLLPADAARIAARFSHQTVKQVAGPFAYDQWIVHQHFNSTRPFYRVTLAGKSVTNLYVSALTGEILQKTNIHERFWNWPGAVVHWIYPTIIRRSYALWDNLVWCLSLVGIFVAVAGLTLGVTRMRAALRKQRKPGFSPYKGLFKWHHMLGLTAGITLCTWIFSGWLSVDHGRIFSTGDPTERQVAAIRGIPMPAALAEISIDRIHLLQGSSEIDFVALNSQAFLVGHNAAPQPQILAASGGPAAPLFTDADLIAAVRAAWPALAFHGLAHIAADDWYADLPDNPMPPDTRRALLGPGQNLWIDINAQTGAIFDVMDPSRRVYCWLFDGLHTLDIPGLPAHPVLQKIIMLSLLAGGFTLSCTAIVLAFRRLRYVFQQPRRNVR